MQVTLWPGRPLGTLTLALAGAMCSGIAREAASALTGAMHVRGHQCRYTAPEPLTTPPPPPPTHPPTRPPLNCLMAKRPPVSLLRAWYTQPYVPSPAAHSGTRLTWAQHA